MRRQFFRHATASSRRTLVAALLASTALFTPSAFAVPGNGNGPQNEHRGQGNGPPVDSRGNGNGGWLDGPRALTLVGGGLFAVALASLVAGVLVVRSKQKR